MRSDRPRIVNNKSRMDTLHYRVPRDDTGEGLRNGPPMLHALLRHRAQGRQADEAHRREAQAGGRDTPPERRDRGKGLPTARQRRVDPEPQQQTARRRRRRRPMTRQQQFLYQ